MRATDLIDPAARQHLETVVLEAERHTTGEIVVAVVNSCDEYETTGWWLGIAAATAALVGTLSFAQDPPWWALLAAQLVALGAARAVTRLPAVRRRLISDELADARAQQRARQCFREQGLTRTRGRTGILIFVALLERRVVVLADKGIDGALDLDESWAQVVDLVRDDLRAGRGVAGLAAAVRRCGEILARHAPIAGDARDIDELPNAVVVED
jgi:putative membrane protein